MTYPEDDIILQRVLFPVFVEMNVKYLRHSLKLKTDQTVGDIGDA